MKEEVLVLSPDQLSEVVTDAFAQYCDKAVIDCGVEMEDEGLIRLWFSFEKTKDVVMLEDGKVVSIGRFKPNDTWATIDDEECYVSMYNEDICNFLQLEINTEHKIVGVNYVQSFVGKPSLAVVLLDKESYAELEKFHADLYPLS